MTDESRLQVRPKGADSSLSLSTGRSGLVARGRRDAETLADGQCSLADAYADDYDEAAEFREFENAKCAREIMRRATEGLIVEFSGEAVNENPGVGHLEGGELRAFLVSLDEFQQTFQKLERLVRESRVVEVLSNIDLKIDAEAEFCDRANLDALAVELRKAGIPGEVVADEEHSAFHATFRDSTNAERWIGVDLSQQPEYLKYRILAKQISRFNKPPFTVIRDKNRDVQTSWRDLLKQIMIEGVERLRRAAEQRDASAQYTLGSAYYFGRGVTSAFGEAVKWYCWAASDGHTNAQWRLGEIFGEVGDHEEALEWYRKAAEQGQIYAQWRLAAAYHCGLVVPQDYAEAVKWFRKAAEQGNTHAQFNLGLAHLRGQGTTQNFAEAARWNRKAADQGDAPARNNLGVIYYHGKGLAQDYAEAAKLWREAAEQGNVDAEFNLGLAYYRGQGLPQDYVRAHMWMNLAASVSTGDEHERYSSERDAAAAKMTPQQIAEAQRLAREWLASHQTAVSR